MRHFMNVTRNIGIKTFTYFRCWDKNARPYYGWISVFTLPGTTNLEKAIPFLTYLLVLPTYPKFYFDLHPEN